MIVKIAGQLVERTHNSLIVNVSGIFYEVIVPLSVLQRVDDEIDDKNHIELITYHYLQISPSSGMPVLVGFFNEIEREFFQQFIKVSGIGPRAAVKALNQPISAISRAIDEGDLQFLKTLPGIGLGKAKEVVAKLQGKVGKYGLIQDRDQKFKKESAVRDLVADWQKEALEVLLQLQYKKQEALLMIEAALEQSEHISSAEGLLNIIYKNKVKI